MLKQRIITAALLLVILLVALLVATPWPLLILLSVAAGCALWEWLRLTLNPGAAVAALPAGIVMTFVLLALGAQLVGSSSVSALASILASLRQVGIPVVAALWVFGATAAVLRANTEARRHGLILSLFGIVAVAALWLALAQLFVVFGAWFLVSMMALIWFADSTAYFVGKAVGRHKLAPRISPGKTWEGALGGVAGVLVWMALSALWGNSFAAVLADRWGFVSMLLLSVLLAALSIVGDLFESLLKRRAGFKDSSQLLPGHGGVYDRIDALFPVAPVALLLVGSGVL